MLLGLMFCCHEHDSLSILTEGAGGVDISPPTPSRASFLDLLGDLLGFPITLLIIPIPVFEINLYQRKLSCQVLIVLT